MIVREESTIIDYHALLDQGFKGKEIQLSQYTDVTTLVLEGCEESFIAELRRPEGLPSGAP